MMKSPLTKLNLMFLLILTLAGSRYSAAESAVPAAAAGSTEVTTGITSAEASITTPGGSASASTVSLSAPTGSVSASTISASASTVSLSAPTSNVPASAVNVPTGNVSGVVLDESSKPVEFATIGVFSEEDSSLVTGSITDENGKFRIDKIPHGDYYIDVRFIGYSNERVEQVSIGSGQSRIDLGSIELRQSTKNIGEVEIVAEQSAVEYKIDRKVISVSQALTASGGTAVDVLETAPSVRTDVNGDILLRGSTSFTVLIDGKPGVLEGNDALRQIPAATIQNIEIMTNPSAKYEPDGTAGIINIVTKKNRQAGVNGVASTSVFTSGEYSTNLNLNRRYGNFNLRGGISLRNRPTPYDWERIRITQMGDTTRYVYGDGEWIWGFGGQSLNLGADWAMNKKNDLSLSANLGQFIFRYDNAANYSDYTVPATNDLFYREDNGFRVQSRYAGLNLNWAHSFDTLGQKLTVNANYSGNINNNGNESYTRELDSEWNPVGDAPARQRGVTDRTSNTMKLNVDYEKPVGKRSKFEAGYQGSLFLAPEDYRWETFDPDRGTWVQDPSRSSSNAFRNNIQAAYVMFANNNRIVNIQAGLRTEYTDRLIESRTHSEKYEVNRLDFYPSLNLSRALGDKNQFQGSFSRRVRRPQQWQLWPNETYVDPTTIWKGNPSLEPEFTNSYELNYMRKFGKSFATLETYFRNTLNDINWVYELQDDGTTLQTFANIDEVNSMGAEILTDVGITRWWTVVASADFFRREVDSRNIGVVKRTANSWNGKVDNSFKLKGDMRFQVSVRYYGEALNAQGTREAYWSTNLGLRQQFLKRKLILTATVKDVFSTVTNITHLESTDQKITTSQYLRGPIFGISLSYAINNYRQRTSETMNLDVSEGGF
jgi:outer membrane receptor protein involved in Fe transport